MTGIAVRDAVPADAPAIAEMIRLLAAHIGDASVANSTAETVAAHGFGEDPLFEAIVAEADEGLVGYAVMTRTYSTWRAAPGVFIVDLYVDDSARGLGVGRALLVQAVRWGERHGCSFLKLDVDPDNLEAHAFYENLGFRDDHDHAMVIEYDRLDRVMLDRVMKGRI